MDSIIILQKCSIDRGLQNSLGYKWSVKKHGFYRRCIFLVVWYRVKWICKVKLLHRHISSSFSFSHSVFYFYQVSYGRLQTLSIWKSLKFDVWERVNEVYFMGRFSCKELLSTIRPPLGWLSGKCVWLSLLRIFASHLWSMWEKYSMALERKLWCTGVIKPGNTRALTTAIMIMTLAVKVTLNHDPIEMVGIIHLEDPFPPPPPPRPLCQTKARICVFYFIFCREITRTCNGKDRQVCTKICYKEKEEGNNATRIKSDTSTLIRKF